MLPNEPMCFASSVQRTTRMPQQVGQLLVAKGSLESSRGPSSGESIEQGYRRFASRRQEWACRDNWEIEWVIRKLVLTRFR